jgi:uncharacterized protein (DUF362 family)/Pyruvate/2-oxoacid:ferredoxin oxidoreductase delta subunit
VSVTDSNTRVALVKAESYDRAHLDRAIGLVVEHIGGLNQYVRPGTRVLLKPNLLSAKAPERAITTHPEFIAAVGRTVKALGGKVLIGDSPAGAEKGIDRLWRNCGLLDIAERDGFELVNFEQSGSRSVAVGNQTYYLAKPVLEADLVISLPKFKTHVLTILTGGIKNCFGCIPGFRKGLYHKEAPKPRLFASVLVDIFSAVRPTLTIVDAVVAMEGDGPSSGSPRPFGLIAASNDAVAIDAVLAAVVGLNPERVYTTRFASERGLGVAKLSRIQIEGERLQDVRITDFALPSSRKMELIPKFVYDSVSHFIWQLPHVEDSACTQCHLCVESCPTGAMISETERSTPEVIDHLCINCWCCHEICPSRAIGIQKSWLARRLRL